MSFALLMDCPTQTVLKWIPLQGRMVLQYASATLLSISTSPLDVSFHTSGKTTDA